MFSRVCCGTGWTWDYVGEFVTLPRLEALMKRWKFAPPAEELIGAYFGLKAEDPLPLLTNEDLARDMHADPRMVQLKGVKPGVH